MLQVLVGVLIVHQDSYAEKEQMTLQNIHVLKEIIVLLLPHYQPNALLVLIILKQEV